MILPHRSKCCLILESYKRNLTWFISLAHAYCTAELCHESPHIYHCCQPSFQIVCLLPSYLPPVFSWDVRKTFYFSTLPPCSNHFHGIYCSWVKCLKRTPRGSVEYQSSNLKTSVWFCRVVLRFKWEKGVWRCLKSVVNSKCEDLLFRSLNAMPNVKCSVSIAKLKVNFNFRKIYITSRFTFNNISLWEANKREHFILKNKVLIPLIDILHGLGMRSGPHPTEKWKDGPHTHTHKVFQLFMIKKKWRNNESKVHLFWPTHTYT